MAGSQLKQLKAALKAKGLVGQTNIKKKNKKLAPSETRKDQSEKKNALKKIHDEFNLFDNRINRAKHDYTVIQNGKFVKAGSNQHNDAARSKSGVEKALQMSYEAEKKMKNRAGGVIDRRFGEKNKNLTEEEKMLERFTRERQGLAKPDKKSMFSLESDDEYEDDDGGFALTHSGKQLSFENDLDGDLGVSEKTYADEDSIQPPRKKSKKEVMAEIIAKSKFHKKQRQMEFQKTQDDIMDLDDEFGDVMSEMRQQKPQNAFSTKSEQDIAYDSRVRELVYDRRAVPADRTKTDEELAKEHEEKMKKLEADRLKRMAGEDVGRAEGDDLDDFWHESDAEDGGVEISENEEDSGSESDTQKKPRKSPLLSMPADHEEFLEQTRDLPVDKLVEFIKKLGESYHPRLAEGNKQKMDNLVGILFMHVLYLADEKNTNTAVVNELTKLLRSMAEQYNQKLVEFARAEIDAIEQRIVESRLKKQDVVFFAIVGYVFSASDHYHLVVTPLLILMNQYLSGLVGQPDAPVELLGQGLLLCDTLLSYQGFAKRYEPEVVKFLETALVRLIPEPAKLEGLVSVKTTGKGPLTLSKSPKFEKASLAEPIKVGDLFSRQKSEAFKVRLVSKAFSVMDRAVGLWKEKSALIEVVDSFLVLVKHATKYFALEMPQLASMAERFSKLSGNLTKSRKPLTLQLHRQLAIPTLTPKFEENFNPDKKSYDPNRDRQELNKMRAQIKKERKSTMKDLRKQAKFSARQQVEEKKAMYGDYHKKMASIVNTISTEEGSAKNQFEKEKRRQRK